MSEMCQLQTRCVVCGGAVTPILDFDEQPLANALLHDAREPFQAFPLGFAFCPHCTHGQLTHFVDRDRLFRTYLYASGTSQTLRNFFEWFAAALGRSVSRGARVLEIASNDGSLLSCLAGQGFDAIGIDPAANLNRIAAAAGHKILTGFFPEIAPEGNFDVVVAMNVAAHTPMPLHFMKGVARLLGPGSIAIIQTSQALMIGNGEFDTIYHEHYSFYTVASMATLATRAGLQLESACLVSVHGVSLLFFLRRADEAASGRFLFHGGAPFAVEGPAREPAFLSESFGGTSAREIYAEFSAKAQALMTKLAREARRHQAEGRQIALVGVAAKAMTLIRAAGISPDLYLDEAPLKIGRYVPGASVAIAPLSSITKLTKDTVFFIGAWNFADELIRKIKSYKLEFDVRFLIPFPEMREET